MKWYSFLVVFCTSCMEDVQGAQPMGLAYDPDHSNGYPANMAAIFRRDFKTMKDNGFTAVRTYRTVFNNVQIGPYAAEAGLQMALGVNLGDANYREQINVAVANAAQFPSYVKYIFIGNEDLVPGSSSPATAASIAGMIVSVKARVASLSVQVGTVQRTTEWVQPSLMGSIVQASDVLGVNVYSFFTPNTPIATALHPVQVQMTQIQALYPSRRALITETGWASNGGLVANNVPSGRNQASYFAQFHDSISGGYMWSGLPAADIYYFQFCDTPYKGGAVEKSFGIFDSNNRMKPDVSTVWAGLSGGEVVEVEVPAPSKSKKTKSKAKKSKKNIKPSSKKSKSKSSPSKSTKTKLRSPMPPARADKQLSKPAKQSVKNPVPTPDPTPDPTPVPAPISAPNLAPTPAISEKQPEITKSNEHPVKSPIKTKLKLTESPKQSVNNVAPTPSMPEKKLEKNKFPAKSSFVPSKSTTSVNRTVISPVPTTAMPEKQIEDAKSKDPVEISSDRTPPRTSKPTKEMSDSTEQSTGSAESSEIASTSAPHHSTYDPKSNQSSSDSETTEVPTQEVPASTGVPDSTMESSEGGPEILPTYEQKPEEVEPNALDGDMKSETSGLSVPAVSAVGIGGVILVVSGVMLFVAHRRLTAAADSNYLGTPDTPMLG